MIFDSRMELSWHTEESKVELSKLIRVHHIHFECTSLYSQYHNNVDQLASINASSYSSQNLHKEANSTMHKEKETGAYRGFERCVLHFHSSSIYQCNLKQNGMISRMT